MCVFTVFVAVPLLLVTTTLHFSLIDLLLSLVGFEAFQSVTKSGYSCNGCSGLCTNMATKQFRPFVDSE